MMLMSDYDLSKISDNDPQAGVRGDMFCRLPERRFLTMRMEVGEAAVPDVRHPGVGQSEVADLVVLNTADCGHRLKH